MEMPKRCPLCINKFVISARNGSSGIVCQYQRRRRKDREGGRSGRKDISKRREDKPTISLPRFHPCEEMALLVPAEAGHAGPCKPLQYLDTHRPWLSLYGTRVRPVPAFGSLSNKPVSDPALIHRILPDELLFEVFARMTPYTLGRAACVCRKWHYAIRSPCLWHNACINTWQLSGLEENYKILQTDFGGSWRKMWLHRPRLRFDGLYVSRNTYIRAGIAEWKTTNPVHLVEAAILYPGLRPTVLRIRLRLRGTTIGANNRLDLVSLVTSGIGENEVKVEEDVLEATEGWQEDETHNPDVPAVSHSRGLSALVFVPFDEVDTSDLNLPVEKMDYFVPG